MAESMLSDFESAAEDTITLLTIHSALFGQPSLVLIRRKSPRLLDNMESKTPDLGFVHNRK